MRNTANSVKLPSSATWRCTQPLHAISNSMGEGFGEFSYHIPYLHHAYSCTKREFTDRYGYSYRCGGQDKSNEKAYEAWYKSFVYKGKPSQDSFPAKQNGQCKKTMEDNDCFEKCLKSEWSLARPNYNVIPNTWLAMGLYTNSINCQDYDKKVNSTCPSQCNVTSIQSRENFNNAMDLYKKVMGH